MSSSTPECTCVKFSHYHDIVTGMVTPRFITVAEYAKRHSLSRFGVHKRIKRGTLHAQKFGKYYLIVDLIKKISEE